MERVIKMNSDEVRRRLMNSALTTINNVIWALRYQPNLSHKEKLEAVVAIEKAIPELRRSYIYFMNKDAQTPQPPKGPDYDRGA